ncbi:transposase [Mesorhizobium sp. WSM2239]|uniref:Transposase n=2 Tax=unclassified Mesorhizobium TaxID=325217 RepID=A0AAU8DKQ1_9HYPH
MADLKEGNSNQVPTEAPVKEETADAKKKAPTPRKGTGRKVRPQRTKSKSSVKQPSLPEATPIAPATRKRYSERERAEKLGEIERQTGRGTSVKDAVKKAGISEQTYYQWKKAAGEAPHGSQLEDLVKLEEENARLKALLAARLRNENAELKKRLGLG